MSAPSKDRYRGVSPGRSEQGKIGLSMMELIAELYPICRSLTGDGVRETLRILRHRIPVDVTEIPTGTTVYDWAVPKEWNIRDAFVKNSSGERVIDFKASNLHVMGYSVPVSTTLSLGDLRSRIYSLPDKPDWVPYRASFFTENWGFSMAHRKLEQLAEGNYEVVIDSSLENGHLTYGELLVPGESTDEVLISTHICHPSLCNDNLSGIAVSTALAEMAIAGRNRLSYRFLFVPSQLGSLAWLSRNENRLDCIAHGLVLVALGHPGAMTYKRSRRGNAEIDRAVAKVFDDFGIESQMLDFVPHGNDERQYCSPGFNLPVGAIMRIPCGMFPQYHTSADDLTCVQPQALEDSYEVCRRIFALLESNERPVSLNQRGEPQLGRRGLYRQTSDLAGVGAVKELPILWVLNLSDGTHSLLDIAERSGLPFADIAAATAALRASGLLSAGPGPGR